MDLRIQKTQKALFQALEDLLLEKPFDKITVKEICERAETRTATFYQHFSDKYDLFSRMFQKKREGFFDIKEKDFNTAQDFIFYLITMSLDNVEPNIPLFYSIQDSTILQTIIQTSTGPLKAVVQDYLRQFYPQEKQNLELEMMTEMLVGSVSQLTTFWVNHKAKLSKEDLLVKAKDIIYTLFPL